MSKNNNVEMKFEFCDNYFGWNEVYENLLSL